jgi:SPP1 gp7 family putative phage head morphogenesis protein
MPNHVKPAVDELGELLDLSTPQFERRMLRLVRVAKYSDDHRRALESLADLIGQTMTLADLIGRKRLLMEADAKRARQTPREFALLAATPIMPSLQFTQAVEDLVRREPRLARSAAAVSELYSTQHAFAMARSADLTITTRVQEIIAKAMRDGATVPEGEALVQAAGDFTRAYSETVYRTNTATAYSAGRFRQVFDPDVQEVIGAFAFDAVMDADTRPNHAAADGLIAATTDPIWETFAVPIGYNCRCSLRMVDRYELEERGLIVNGRVQIYRPPNFANAHPDSGFGKGRPDRRLYGGSFI